MKLVTMRPDDRDEDEYEGDPMDHVLMQNEELRKKGSEADVFASDSAPNAVVGGQSSNIAPTNSNRAVRMRSH